MGALKQTEEEKTLLPQDIGTDYTFKRKIVWFNAIGFFILHLLALYGGYRLLHCHILTPLFALALMFVSGEGITLGAHRLYSHKAFKASFVVRLAVIILHTIAGQNCLYIWVRDHRQHHKYSDTDADPHNSNRGFFFSHIGWLMSRKHPAVIAKGKTIDMSDLENDSLVMLQKEHYKFLYIIFAIGIPIAIPIYGWNESFTNSLFISYFGRYILQLHATWLINSATHLYGTKPYDKFMNPVENYFISMIALGEGWHNYHHAFPSDYRAAEYGVRYSITTFLIDALAFFGLVYDLKEANSEQVKIRAVKKGDGSHPVFGKQKEMEVNFSDRQVTANG
ncbi:acyl-CoA desaturase 1 isoform X2 [Tribolium castaneum]|uniref:Acyl-CoA desaturase 2-like Protein n=1 Tax=Tribolium castaneum TaxID=7070 RepID=D6W9N6_TRICA|nr:PREDICTED: acyl-CoA desaturase 1 [Tribolium castaneum]XP_974033.1 PREDICTED: acyl-CoA desaturase 1 [Tribolium castaneum]EEZ98125.1 Acyl-CoA desaturase 2-like Protein [Tribolium castaneum]|eukprot:XP_015840580.1 PREDICTED: acyl-CoA desaturase 1 [Tribolium castaneum]